MRSGGGSEVGLRLAGVGYGDALASVAAVAPRAQANRVVYAHNGGVEEWYANGPLGLEQGFTLAHAPAGQASGALTLSVALSGDLRASLADGARALTFARAGRRVLGYRGLVATDARGRRLRSWLELQGGRLSIRVDARGAVYPVRIDPFIQQAKLTASDSAPFDLLGDSVAVSADGSTVVAGALGATVSHGARPGRCTCSPGPPAGGRPAPRRRS